MKLAGVEKLIESIIEEAEREAARISGETEQKKAHAKQKLAAAVERKTRDILENANKTGAEQKKRMLAVYGLELRKEQLTVKRAALEEAYQKALAALKGLGKDEYLALVKKILLNTVSTGKESVLIGSDEKHIDAAFIQGVNAELQQQGKTGALALSGKKAAITSGFILQEGGMAIDCSFDMLIKELRDETETQAANILFG
jgi:V/A-type H+-transporting ATPase subunit E